MVAPNTPDGRDSAHLLSVQLTAKADASKGRFRSFLLGAYKRYMASEEAKARAQKRGGGKIVFSYDAQQTETRFAAESMIQLSPEVIFDRHWALAMFEEALRLLEVDEELEHLRAALRA